MQRGEIYYVSLDPIVGREQSGRRPVLVVSGAWVNSRPLVVTVVPGTDGANVPQDHPTNIRVTPEESGLASETVFMCFQIRALDPSRFTRKPAGQLSQDRLLDIQDAIRFCLEM